MANFDLEVTNKLKVDIEVSCTHGQGAGGTVRSGTPNKKFKFSSNDGRVTAAFTPQGQEVRPQDAIGCKSPHNFFIKKTKKEWEVKITGPGDVKFGDPTNVEVGTPQ
jgi:hypothetical protein